MTGYTTNNRNWWGELSWSEESSLQEQLDEMYGIASGHRATKWLSPQIQWAQTRDSDSYRESVAEKIWLPDGKWWNKLQAQFQASRKMNESRRLRTRFWDRTPEFDVLEITFSIWGGGVVREYWPRTYIQNRKDELREKYKDKIHLTITQEIRCC